MQVHTLINPSVEQFREAQQAVQPNLLYLQGQQLDNEIGSLVWGDTDLSDLQTFSSLISPPFPTIVSSKLLLNVYIACIHRCNFLFISFFSTGENEMHKCTLN